MAGGVSDRSDDSKPSGRVSAWVSDGAESTGVALVVVETNAVTTGRIGNIGSHLHPVQSTCSWRQWFAIYCCNYGGILALVDVEAIPSERALPDDLLPLVQVRFECFAVPLDGRLAGSLKHTQCTIVWRTV